jgi:hypothetical protein
MNRAERPPLPKALFSDLVESQAAEQPSNLGRAAECREQLRRAGSALSTSGAVRADQPQGQESRRE